ncbi:MAG: HIT domain-containing protein [Verrucomicrobiae bacterium]|jgi:ATP adenylyltransferase|nr:HIT domain-containing protein [Verrucomicrobiae bacterium]
MDNLHAPWRIDYILAPKNPAPGRQSVFSEIAASSDDISNHVLARGKTCFAVLNAYPYSCGHSMVIPYRQVSDLTELTDAELLESQHVLQRLQRAMRATMNPAGFNIGLNLGKVAGAGIVEHLHWHIVPRWEGDTNFMPVIGNTGVMPEAMLDVAAKIRASLEAHGA